MPTTQTTVSVSISTLLYIQYSYLHNKSPPSFYMHMWQSWIELQILVYREFQVYSTGLIGATLMYYIFMFLKSMYEPHPLSATVRLTRWCTQNTQQNNIYLIFSFYPALAYISISCQVRVHESRRQTFVWIIKTDRRLFFRAKNRTKLKAEWGEHANKGWWKPCRK